MDPTKQLESLKAEVHDFHKMQQKRHGHNFWIHWCLVCLVLMSNAALAFGGILKWDHELIACIAVVSGTLVALHTAIAIGDKAHFQRIVASDAENLLTDLNAGVDSDERLRQLREYFKALRKHSDVMLPLGGGMDAVRSLPQLPTGRNDNKLVG